MSSPNVIGFAAFECGLWCRFWGVPYRLRRFPEPTTCLFHVQIIVLRRIPAFTPPTNIDQVTPTLKASCKWPWAASTINWRYLNSASVKLFCKQATKKTPWSPWCINMLPGLHTYSSMLNTFLVGIGFQNTTTFSGQNRWLLTSRLRHDFGSMFCPDATSKRHCSWHFSNQPRHLELEVGFRFPHVCLMVSMVIKKIPANTPWKIHGFLNPKTWRWMVQMNFHFSIGWFLGSSRSFSGEFKHFLLVSKMIQARNKGAIHLMKARTSKASNHMYSPGTNISHLGKRNIIFKSALGRDMSVPTGMYIHMTYHITNRCFTSTTSLQITTLNDKTFASPMSQNPVDLKTCASSAASKAFRITLGHRGGWVDFSNPLLKDLFQTLGPTHDLTLYPSRQK